MVPIVTRTEINDAIVLCDLQSKNLTRAVSVAKQGVSRDVREALFRALLDSREIDDALEIARLGISSESVERMIALFVDQGWDLAFEAVKLRRGGKFTRAEVDSLVDKKLDHCDLNSVKRAIEIAELGASEVAIDRLVGCAMHLCNIDDVVVAAKLRRSGKLAADEIEVLVRTRVEVGCSDEAIKAVRLRKWGSLRPGEVEKLVRVCLNNGDTVGAKRAAKLRVVRGLTHREINFLVSACIREGKIGEAIRAAMMRPGRALTESEIRAIDGYVQNLQKRIEEMLGMFNGDIK